MNEIKLKDSTIALRSPTRVPKGGLRGNSKVQVPKATGTSKLDAPSA